MYYPDMSPCGEFGFTSEKLLAVGWLDPVCEYSRGDVSEEFAEALTRLLVNPWQPSVFMGHQPCPFCRLSSGPRDFNYKGIAVQVGASNVFVPNTSNVLVAPSLVLHYLDAHGYGPPTAFCEAVLNCPQMRSIEYLKAMKKSGPPELFAHHQ